MKEYEVVKNLQIEDLNFFMVDIKYRTPHMHKEIEVGLFVSGEMEIRTESETRRFKAGDIMIHGPRQVHEFRSIGEGTVIMILQVTAAFFKKCFPQMQRVCFEKIKIEQKKGEKSLRSIMLDIADAYLGRKDNYEFFCVAKVFELMGTIMNVHPHHFMSDEEMEKSLRKRTRLWKIIEYIDAHYSEKILLSDIAEHESLSLYYLSRLLKDYLGMPFQKYLALKRFETARILVEQTNRSISDICIECGFSDYRHLNKIYVEQLGYTPTEYRKSHKVQEGKIPSSAANSTERYLTHEESVAMLHNARQEMSN